MRLQTSSLQVFSLSFDLLYFPFSKSGINNSTPEGKGGVLGAPDPFCYQRKETLLSLIPSWVGLLPGPHPLINVSKCTTVIPKDVQPPAPGTCPKPPAHCFGMGTSFGCHWVGSGFSQCLPRGQKRTECLAKKIWLEIKSYSLFQYNTEAQPMSGLDFMGES